MTRRTYIYIYINGVLNTDTGEISKQGFKFPLNSELISADAHNRDIYIDINGVLNTHTGEISKYGFKFH